MHCSTVTLQFAVVLFAIVCKVSLAFGSLDEILKCDHQSNESYGQHFPVAMFTTLYTVGVPVLLSRDAIQGGVSFYLSEWHPGM